MPSVVLQISCSSCMLVGHPPQNITMIVNSAFTLEIQQSQAIAPQGS